MTESIAVVRLTRNLRYKLTYIRIFESFLESAQAVEMTELLRELIEVQHEAIAMLSSYLRRLDVTVQDEELNEKLMTQAANRGDPKAQLRFIYDGLQRAAAWYRMQLVDRQMSSDAELRRVLVVLGEMDAAKLWRTEAVMDMLRIPLKQRETEPESPVIPEPTREEPWRPRLMDDLGRPAWSGERTPPWSVERKPSRPKTQRPRGPERSR